MPSAGAYTIRAALSQKDANHFEKGSASSTRDAGLDP